MDARLLRTDGSINMSAETFRSHLPIRSFPELRLRYDGPKMLPSKKLECVINHHIARPPGARKNKSFIQPAVPLVTSLHRQVKPHPELRRPRWVLLIAQTLKH